VLDLPPSHDWCAGLSVSRSRRLTAPESDRLRSIRRTALAKVSLALVGAVLTLGLCATAMVFVSAPADSFIGMTALVLTVGALFVGLPVCLAIANDHFKRAGALKQQLRNPEVLVCEGAVEELAGQRETIAAILGQIHGAAEVMLEVLVPSGLVWTINGHAQTSWTLVASARTARTPQHARLAARLVRPVETDEGTIHVHQRPLSEGERVELRSYVRNMPLKAVLIVLVLNIAAIAKLVLYAQSPAGVPLLDGILVAGAVWCDLHVHRAFRTRQRMLKDFREAFVVIYQPDADGLTPEETVVEFLPHTGLEWTRTGGRPARWRRVYGTVGEAPIGLERERPA
jgi:hypothetical protein